MSLKLLLLLFSKRILFEKKREEIVNAFVYAVEESWSLQYSFQTKKIKQVYIHVYCINIYLFDFD